MSMKNDSPALTEQSEHYPASWGGKVPLRVRMEVTVISEIPGEQCSAVVGREYDAWVNSYGALSAILEDGEMLGLKPHEFTVTAWHEVKKQAKARFEYNGKSIIVDYCPYCSGKHVHLLPVGKGIRMAGCLKGEYVLDFEEVQGIQE